MEDEELNEEVMGDPDKAIEVTETVEHDEVDAGEAVASEEPMPDIHYAEMEEMRQHISVLEDKIGGLLDSISTIVECGGTIMESGNPDTSSEDKAEPYLYLEDLDYSM